MLTIDANVRCRASNTVHNELHLVEVNAPPTQVCGERSVDLGLLLQHAEDRRRRAGRYCFSWVCSCRNA